MAVNGNFGETVEDFLLYIAPKTQEDMDSIGFTVAKIEKLLREKSDIVFSYLPFNYRRFFYGRVHRLVLLKKGDTKKGQTSAKLPFSGVLISNVVAYKNPKGSMDDFIASNNEVAGVAINGNNLDFPSLSKGDMIIIDFDLDLSNFNVPVLEWASYAKAAIHVLKILSEDQVTGETLGRVETEITEVSELLDGINNQKGTGERKIIKQLDFDFWDADNTFRRYFKKAHKDRQGEFD